VDSVEEGILGAATELLSSEGASALTVRRLADRAGVSTMGIYSRFGGKNGVVEALYVEGFHLLRNALSDLLEIPDPIGRLRAYGRVYRRTALANSSHYELMFGRAVPEYVPSEAARAEALGTFELVLDAARYAIDEGALQGAALPIAIELWALVHGHVSLELTGDLPSGTDREAALLRAIDHAVIGLGSRPD